MVVVRQLLLHTSYAKLRHHLNMGYKIAVSKSRFNVLTETDPNNLIFSSDYNTLKYDIAGTLSFSMGGSGSQYYENSSEITHNLGYVPFFWAEGRLSGYTAGVYDILPTGLWEYSNIEVYADTTKIYCYAQIFLTSAVTFYYYYKIFKNNLGL